MSIMTEAKLMGMVSELLDLAGIDAEYRGGLHAGFYDIETLCQLSKIRCAEGVAGGKLLRQYLLQLRGRTDDEIVEAEIIILLALDVPEKVPSRILPQLDWAMRRSAAFDFSAVHTDPEFEPQPAI